MAGFDPFSLSEEQYTVPIVEKEMSGSSMAWLRFEMAIESGKLRIESPRKIFVDEAKASATLIGDAFFLSEVDLHVLALALQLKAQGYSPLIASDDYSIQNVANQMGIEFASLATFGIRFQFHWIRYCPACHKEYQANYNSRKCEICDTELKRKPSRKQLLE